MKVTATSDWRETIAFETPMIVAEIVPGDPTRCSVCGGDSELRPRTELWAVKHRHPNHHAGYVRFYCQAHLPVIQRPAPPVETRRTAARAERATAVRRSPDRGCEAARDVPRLLRRDLRDGRLRNVRATGRVSTRTAHR